MSESCKYDHLVHIRDHSELGLYELIPNVVWIFDLDKHGWWWGNSAAVSFWNLNTLQELIDKDLSGDTQGARDRTLQTFELAAKDGLTVDPWTTYPNGKPKTLLMMHRAVLLGPDKHRGIIAYINEQVNLGEQPENLLLMEAMRYTRVPATSFTFEGEPLVENPAATDAYKHLHEQPIPQGDCAFIARFVDREEGRACLKRIQDGEEGRWDFIMQTSEGSRRHSLDIRRTRHPLNGDFLFLVVEYDFTELYEALAEVEAARADLHEIAMTDTLTGVSSLHYMQEVAAAEIAQAARADYQLAVMFIDLDGFKSINDAFGHEVGDNVLCEVAQRVKATIPTEDMLARIGGDEFVVLLSHDACAAGTEFTANRILKEIEQPLALNGYELSVSASIGIAFYPNDGRDLEALLKTADDAMYSVKRNGKNAFACA
ncbi:GGDEF domain-containing protein [Marinobacterium jannaschii]|uniref:GGDEF domain-containing protein n=1 Tax=Marinobacterium jannaschii TaxID=64970 RepID=UPI00048758E7|nr:GGDEF domain-containing protein [Marinobacterium jannaschii]